ncbi:MAG: hypothetical protein GF353_26835 [Candidatus Lokiarchaeota archaeon]|nr:hypothetical protein [Candidatus Lokiarchaeota archaeon]
MKKVLIGLFVLSGLFLAGYFLGNAIMNTGCYLKGTYEISWSGTTAEHYKVNDHDEGKFKEYCFFVCDDFIYIEHITSGEDSLNIKLWINIKDPDKPYIFKYEIKTDYSGKKADDILMKIPCTINGSGHGSWDWQDTWKIKVKKIVGPQSIWDLEETLILLNFLTVFCADITIIYANYFKDDI